MKLKPLFSIIIPSLNEELALPLLLQDLTNQSYKNFEVILVDAHSEDKTIKRANHFTKKLPLLTIINSPQRNVSIQRNQGAKIAKGDYLIFCDADNRLPKYFLEGIKYNLSRKKVNLFTCWCSADTDKPGDKAIATLLNIAVETSKKIDYPGALGAMIGCPPATFKKIGEFNPTIAFAEDRDFVHRAHKKNIDLEIFKDPRYIVSLRRYRKAGKLKSLQQYAKLNLKILTQKDITRSEYPMGGQAFKDNPDLQTFIDKIQSILKTAKKKPQLKMKLRSLIDIFENNGF